MPINIPTLKRKPNEEDDVLTKQRNEAMVHMAKLAYERMKRIDGEDHERGLKEHQYNNSVKYQRMVEYELNNPGETATGVLEYEAIFKRSRRRRVKRRLMREAVAEGGMDHVPRSLRPRKHILRAPDPSKIVYNRFTPWIQREEIERELKSKSTLSDIVVGLMSKSGRNKKPVTERGRKQEREYGRAHYRGPSSEDDRGYVDFRDYEFGETRHNSFPRMQGTPVNIRPSIYEAYEGYEDQEIPVGLGQPPYAYGYPGVHGPFPYGEGVGYNERRRFSVPTPYHDPYRGVQPQYREATSLPDIRAPASVEEQIDELLDAVERSSLTGSDMSGALDGISDEVEDQLGDVKAGKRRAGGAGDTVVECVALEDLPPVIQTIAIAREDARLEFEEEMGYGSLENGDVAPMLVDLFALAQFLAQGTL